MKTLNQSLAATFSVIALALGSYCAQAQEEDYLLPKAEHFDIFLPRALQGNFEKRDASGELECQALIDCNFGWYEWTKIGHYCSVSTYNAGFTAGVASSDSTHLTLSEKGTGIYGPLLFQGVHPIVNKGDISLNADGSVNVHLETIDSNNGNTESAGECIGARKI